MREPVITEKTSVECPFCDSFALYRYGRASSGKKRFLCLMCGKQFTIGSSRLRLKDKPACPACGKTMNIYKRGTGFIRFRCSGYPGCRTFKKIYK